MTSNSKINGSIEEMVFLGITSVLNKHNKSIWTGTMTNLLNSVNREFNKNQKTISPKSPAALRIIINRIVNRLRNRGIGVKFGRTSDHSRTRFVKFTQ